MKDVIINNTDKIINEEEMLKLCGIVFKKLDVVNPLFNIVLVNKEEIQRINREYRGKDAVTDVISFAFEEENRVSYEDMRFIGEIYICVERAEEQAEEYGHSFKREILFLVTHGLLHLLGYDHIEEKDRIVMRAKEEEILGEMDAKR